MGRKNSEVMLSKVTIAIGFVGMAAEKEKAAMKGKDVDTSWRTDYVANYMKEIKIIILTCYKKLR